MAIKLDSMIDEKNQARTDWIEARKAEREELNSLSDDGLTMVTESPEVYRMYLDIQALNPSYSANNVILAMQQGNNMSILGSAERWKKLGRLINKESAALKIRVSEAYQRDGQEHTGYKVGTVYDISQTSGRPLVQITLSEGSEQIETAVKALVNMSPVPLQTVDDDMGQSSFYDSEDPTIFIQNGLTDQETYTALSKELVHAWIHNKGAYAEYDRSECDLDAGSVAYMISKRYGISTPYPDTSLLTQQYGDLETQDRRLMLDSLQRMLKKMDNAIEREISPQHREDRPQTPKRNQPYR